jgi:hypothetical protein
MARLSHGVVIGDQVAIFNNALGQINNLGTGTYDQRDDLHMAIADHVWGFSLDGVLAVGTAGNYIRNKLLTISKFIGLK